MRSLERLPRESSRDYALRTIKENIIDLTLAPGSQISENELAVELGLSRTPGREALIELSKIHIIEIHPQRKTTVTLIDDKMVEESRFMRDLLECAVVELDCERAAPADLERLNANIRLQSLYLEDCCTNAGKARIFQQLRNLSIHADRVRGMALSSDLSLTVVQDHRDLVGAIGRRDGKAARELMEIHLDRYQIDTAAIREMYPQYFK